MRRVVDLLLGLMLVSILGGAVMYVQRDRSEAALRDTAREQRRRFQQQIALQAALERGNLNERGFPTTIDPTWFNSDLPSNPLIGAANPWVEVAPQAYHDMDNPPDIVVLDEASARFWYNPWQGIIRARVPAGVSDNATLELYNYVNEVDLQSLFPTRTP
jgi:type II secretory pathway pseudopilin PulG